MAGAKKGVVAVDTDGSIKWYFVSRADAERFMKICHKDMGRALKDHSLHVRGYAMYYESEYREGWFAYGEEHFAWQPDPNRLRFGSGFVKGHQANYIYKMSEEGKKIKSETSRRTCLMRKERGDYAIQAEKLMKPVRCVTDGMEFKSVKHCGTHYGIPPNQISEAIRRKGTTRNLKFEYI
jgi:hypothetical protein